MFPLLGQLGQASAAGTSPVGREAENLIDFSFYSFITFPWGQRSLGTLVPLTQGFGRPSLGSESLSLSPSRPAELVTRSQFLRG